MKIRTVGIAAAFLLPATSAFAVSSGCAAIDGYSVGSAMFSSTFTTSAFEEGEVVTLTADSLTATNLPPTTSVAAVFYFVDASFSRVSASTTYLVGSGPVSETLVVPAGGISGLGFREDTGAGSYYTTFTNLHLSCSAAPDVDEKENDPVAALIGRVAEISLATQQQSLTRALSQNFRARFGGAGSTVSRNGLYFSTQDMPGNRGTPMEYTAWGSLTGRVYRDGLEGHSVDFVVGADRFVAPETLVGLMFGGGVTELEDNDGNSASAHSFLVGTYGAHQYASGLMTDGYLAYSGANYEADGIDIDTDRFLIGVSLSGEMVQPTGVLTPRMRLDAAWEQFPDDIDEVAGGTARRAVLGIGARYDWTTLIVGTGLSPFVSADMEFGWSESANGTSDKFASPRIGLGVSGVLAGGSLSTGFDIGRTTSETYDYGLRLSYAFTF